MENARVALVHDWFPVRRGGEKVLEVFAEIFPEAPIYALFHFPGSQVEEIEKKGNKNELYTAFAIPGEKISALSSFVSSGC
ncbi:hypothetical protein ES703_69167 [subsurface metagenome]